LEIPIEAVAVTLQPRGEELVGELMNWAWNDNNFRARYVTAYPLRAG
jgi:hypothetical protein